MSLTPVIKCAGGKRRLLPQIHNFIPEFSGIYFEPFIGGGALFFDLSPEKAVISDKNKEIMGIYEEIRDNPQELIEKLEKLQKIYNNLESLEEKREMFYKFRKKDPNEIKGSVFKAVRTIFLNKTCFNGLYRLNSKGEFNTSFGKHEKIDLFEEENIMEISKLLNKDGITINNGDFLNRELNSFMNKNDFVYLDPPYFPLKNKIMHDKYTADGFSLNCHLELRRIFGELTKKKIKCLLSNSDSEFIKKLYRKFNIEKIKVYRNISSTVENRGEINELLIMNY